MILIGSGYAGLDPISKKFKHGDEACIVPDAQFLLVYLYTRVIPTIIPLNPRFLRYSRNFSVIPAQAGIQ